MNDAMKAFLSIDVRRLSRAYRRIAQHILRHHRRHQIMSPKQARELSRIFASVQSYCFSSRNSHSARVLAETKMDNVVLSAL